MKKILSALALAAGLLLATAPASAVIMVTFTPSSTHINVGDDVNIDVAISGLDAEILSAVDLNFLFSGAAAAWNIADFTGLTDALNQGNAGDSVFAFDTVSAGNIGVQAYSLLDDATLVAMQANSFLLGTLTMHGVTDGVTNIAFGPDADFERNFIGLDALSLNLQLGSACIAVGTGSCDGGGGNAPEPASLALMGMALFAAVAASRTRRRTRDTA